MFSSVFAIILLLLYFWYITLFPSSSKYSKPTQTSLEKAPKTLTHHIKTRGKNFRFLIDATTVWEDTLPEPYQVINNKFVTKDPCFGKPNGSLIPATGQDLYEYVQQDNLNFQNFTFEPNASLVLQDKSLFYFSCQQNRIEQLHMCPPGQYFRISTCYLIDQCANQKDGKTFPDPFNLECFYECHNEKAILKTCPPDTIFAYDSCSDPMKIGIYCSNVAKPQILDIKTLVVCREGKLTYEVCPPGFRYFDKPTCELEACVGKPNGHLVPLPPQQMGPLSYSPGYMECLSDKVHTTNMCPQEWDSYLSHGENLIHLPQVFDGQKCTIPEFCVNVEPNDSNVIVPVHEFTKHVRNWVYSDAYDRMEGFRCEGSTRKRVALDPGNIINKKRLKIESACNDSSDRVMIPIVYQGYFNCKTKTDEMCPIGQFFDGYQCRPNMTHAFEYKNLQLFQLDSLREDNWMVPWEYSKYNSIEPCKDPETEYLNSYNVCSHPDCTLYPWLSQIDFQVALKDGTICKFDDQTRYIHKEETEDKYLYWAQRRVHQVDPQEICQPGQNIQSGHLIFDKTIYATCNDSQPFVFCPSSSTKGIIEVQGQYWACEPEDMTGIIPPHTTVTFTTNEIEKLLPASNNLTEVLIYTQKIIIPPSGYFSDKRFTLTTKDEPVKVIYRYRVSHPPEVAWPNKVSKFPGAFIMKAQDFTRKHVEIPRYKIKDSATSITLP